MDEKGGRARPGISLLLWPQINSLSAPGIWKGPTRTIFAKTCGQAMLETLP